MRKKGQNYELLLVIFWKRC